MKKIIGVLAACMVFTAFAGCTKEVMPISESTNKPVGVLIGAEDETEGVTEATEATEASVTEAETTTVSDTEDVIFDITVESVDELYSIDEEVTTGVSDIIEAVDEPDEVEAVDVEEKPDSYYEEHDSWLTEMVTVNGIEVDPSQKVRTLKPVLVTSDNIITLDGKDYGLSNVNNDANMQAEKPEEQVYNVYSDSNITVYSVGNYGIIQHNGTNYVYSESYYTDFGDVGYSGAEGTEFYNLLTVVEADGNYYFTTPYMMGMGGHSSGVSYVTVSDNDVEVTIFVNLD